jgi:selenide,water dikinase
MTDDGKNLVLVGGGHTHVLFLKRLTSESIPNRSISLISPQPRHSYSGMVPGVIAGHYGRAVCEIDLVSLCRTAGVGYIVAEVGAIDPDLHSLVLKTGKPLLYDLVSLDVGSTLRPDVFDDQLVSAKPMSTLLDRWDGFLDDLEMGVSAPSVCVIGGGVAGIELIAAMDFRLKRLGYRDHSLTLVQGSDCLAPELMQAQSSILASALHDLDINVITNTNFTISQMVNSSSTPVTNCLLNSLSKQRVQRRGIG